MLLIGLVIGGIIGAAAGAYGAWSYSRNRCEREVAEIAGKSAADIASTSARLDEWSKQIARLEAELARRTRELEQAVAESSAVRQERARIAAELEAERRAGAEKLALLKDAETKLREAFASLSSEALRQNSQSFLELGEDIARRVPAGGDGRPRQAADGDHGAGEADPRVAGEGRHEAPGRREGARRGVQPAARAGEDAGHLAAAPRVGDGKPREGAADAERARPLGGDPAAARRRAGRHARPLRLPGAANGDDGRRSLPAGRRGAVAGAQAGGRRRQGAADVVPAGAGGDGRRRARGDVSRPRAAGARARDAAEQQGVLVAVLVDAGDGDHVPAGRDVLQRRAAVRPDADRVRRRTAGDHRQPDDADRAAAVGGVRLAAGADRRERAADQPARARSRTSGC